MRYSQTKEEIRAQINKAFTEREASFRRASEKARIVTGVQPYTPKPVDVRDCSKGAKSISPQAQGEALMPDRIITQKEADDLRLIVFGLFAPDNPRGL